MFFELVFIFAFHDRLEKIILTTEVGYNIKHVERNVQPNVEENGNIGMNPMVMVLGRQT